ncbi:MAG: structural protein [Thermoanaerobaculia bacterium]
MPQEVAPGTFRLDDGTAFPTTISGITADEAITLASVLGTADEREGQAWLDSFFSRPDVRWLELDTYVEKWRPTYVAAKARALKRLEREAFPDGTEESLDEEDHDDLVEQAAQEAAAALPEKPYGDDSELAAIFEGSPPRHLTPFLLRMTYYAAAAHALRIREASSFPVKGWQVDAISDQLTCRECRKRNRKLFPANAPPSAPFHVACRCTIVESERAPRGHGAPRTPAPTSSRRTGRSRPRAPRRSGGCALLLATLAAAAVAVAGMTP